VKTFGGIAVLLNNLPFNILVAKLRLVLAGVSARISGGVGGCCGSHTLTIAFFLEKRCWLSMVCTIS